MAFVGWFVGWLYGLSVENFQSKTTTGAYCAPALESFLFIKVPMCLANHIKIEHRIAFINRKHLRFALQCVNLKAQMCGIFARSQPNLPGKIKLYRSSLFSLLDRAGGD